MKLVRPAKIPSAPGVYFFKDNRGKILYIGKAASLRSRLAWYFSKPLKAPKVAALLKKAARVDWRETDSEIEALILESQLIKQHRPPYNILLRDDKQYAYVVFTKEEFPKVFVTHQPSTFSATEKVLGPFTDAWALKETLRLLRRLFPYCTCKQIHHNYCLNYHIGKCLGFCCLKISEKRKAQSAKNNLEYRKNINALENILSGRKQNIARQLEKEMRSAGQRADFEKAIQLRGQWGRLERVFENARVIQQLQGRSAALAELQKLLALPRLLKRIECYDIANIQGRYATGALVVLTNGQPDKNEYRQFRVRTVTGGDVAMLREVLARRFRHPEWPTPDLIIIDGGKAQFNVARAVVPADIPFVALTKNEKHQGEHIFINGQKTPIKLSGLPATARQLMLRITAETHRFAVRYYRQLHRRALR